MMAQSFIFKIIESKKKNINNEKLSVPLKFNLFVSRKLFYGLDFLATTDDYFFFFFRFQVTLI